MATFSALIEIYEKYFDPRKHFEEYCSSESCLKEDTIKGALKQLGYIFSSGAVKGDSILKIGTAHFIHMLLPPCCCFKEIIVADLFDRNLEEVRKWVKKEPGAIDITAAAKFISELQGDREQWIENQEKLRRLITQIIKCDITDKNPLSPLALPPVDCVYLMHCLECVCVDRKTYFSALKNITSLLKTGGHLIMVVALECTFYMVGKFKCPSTYVNEDFLRRTIHDTGYCIIELINFPRIDESTYSVTDFTSAAYIVARKL